MTNRPKILVIALIVIFVLLLLGNGVQGYYLYKKVKANRALQTIINNKSNCDKCPAPTVETPAATTPTPTTTTPSKKKSSGSSSGSSGSSGSTDSGSGTTEVVIPPPPPPAD